MRRGREAYKAAWFWGGSFGLLGALFIGLAGFELGSLNDLIERMSALSPGRIPEASLGFMLGLLFAALAQSIAFLFAWIVWWAGKRL